MAIIKTIKFNDGLRAKRVGKQVFLNKPGSGTKRVISWIKFDEEKSINYKYKIKENSLKDSGMSKEETNEGYKVGDLVNVTNPNATPKHRIISKTKTHYNVAHINDPDNVKALPKERIARVNKIRFDKARANKLAIEETDLTIVELNLSDTVPSKNVKDESKKRSREDRSVTTNTKADKEPSNLKRMQDRYKSEKAKTTVSETFTVKHKKTNTVLSSHDSYSAAKDAHKKLEDRSKYGIYQMKNTSDSPLKNRTSPNAGWKANEEYISEALRLVKTYEHNGRKAKIYKDNEWGEHRVKFYTHGKHHKDADHHTDDSDDAHGTAKHWLNKMTNESKKPLRSIISKDW